MEYRYPALRVIAVALKVVGWACVALGTVIFVGSIIGALVVLEQEEAVALLIGSGGLGALVLSVIALIAFYAMAESILVLVHIEQNTRLAAKRLGAAPNGVGQETQPHEDGSVNAERMQLFCQMCGKKNRPGRERCWNCGEPLE